jgi:hypothetical protein
VRAAAEETGIGNRMVRRAERAVKDQGLVAFQRARDAVDARGFERLFQLHFRRIEGMRRASMVLPAPGEPIMSRLWPPLTATSMARLALS